MPKGPAGGPRPGVGAQQVLNILVLDSEYLRDNIQYVVDAAANNFDSISSIADMGYGEPDKFEFGGMMDIALRESEVNIADVYGFINEVNGDEEEEGWVRGSEDDVLSQGNWLLKARTEGVLSNITPLAEATQKITIRFNNTVPGRLQKEASQIAYDYMHNAPKGSPQTGAVARGKVDNVIIESNRATVTLDYDRADRSHIKYAGSNIERALQGVHDQIDNTDRAMEVYNATPSFLREPDKYTVEAE